MDVPNYEDIEHVEHPYAMIVVKDLHEFKVVSDWAEKEFNRRPYIGEPEKFPMGISPNEHSGWSDQMDRALYYISFVDFVRYIGE